MQASYFYMTFSALISHSILLTWFTVNSTTFIVKNSRRHANVIWNYNTCKLKLLLFSIWVFSIFFYPCEYISGLYTRTHFLPHVSDFVNICFTAFLICSQPSLTSSQLVYECICVSVSPCVCVCVSARMQNRSLQGDVRGMRALRDELDCARERAARSEQLQTELQSCKHRLRSLELTRTQLKVHTHTKHTSHTIEKSSNTATSPLQNT